MTMREKIARAMCAGFVERRSKGDSYAFKADWDAMQPVMQEFWLRFADAALDALMEPTEEMQLAYDKMARSDLDCPMNRWPS